MAVLAAGSGNNLVTSATRASFSTTVAGWFKLSSLGAGSQSLVACGSTTNVIASNVDATSGLSMLVNSTPTTSYTAPLTPGKWYWIGFRIDSSGNATTFIGSLRRDGTAVVYFGNTVTAANVTTVLRLFTDHNGGFSLAAAENVMVWASARTDQQIADAAVLGYDPVVAGTSPWAWWKLANATDLSDYSGNARGLTLNGSISTVSGPTATPSWGSGTSVAVKCCGNSITAGYDHSPIPPTYPSTLALLRPTFTVQNLGHDGAGTLSLLAENDLFYSVGYDNIVLFSESINDASYGPDDTTTCLTKIASYVRFAHALGFDCIIGTVLPYNNNSGFGFTNPTATDGVNTALRGGAIQGADYLADNGADSYWSNPNDTAVFRDGAHPTDVGYAHLAGNWNTALTAYLATLNLAINTQPTDQFASVAGSATFTVAATASSGSLTYQWRRRQTSTGTPANIGGATSSSYTRSTLSIADSGWYYDCVVTDSNGSATTSLARLVLVFSADAFLYAGQSNATDVKLRDPTTSGGALPGDFSGAAAISLTASGALNGTGAVTGTATATVSVSGAVTGSGTLAGSLLATVAAAGALSGSGTLAGSSLATLSASGAISGTGALAGTSQMSLSSAATLTGSGSIAAAATLTVSAGGIVAGAGALSGGSTATISLSGVLAGTGGLAGTTSATVGSAGTVAGAGALAGSSLATLSAAGAVAGVGAVAGTSSLSISASATFDLPSGAFSGACVLTLSGAGTLAGTGTVSGSTAAAVSAAGALAGSGALTGASSLSLVAAAAVTGVGALAGSSLATVTAAGAVTGTGALAGAATLTLTASGTMSLPNGAFSGAATMTIAVAGAVTGVGTVAGPSTLSLAASATLGGAGVLAGACVASMGAAGALSGGGALAGATAIALAGTGALTGLAGLAGSATATLAASGLLKGAGVFAGGSILTLVASGSLTQPTEPFSGTATFTLSVRGRISTTQSLASPRAHLGGRNRAAPSATRTRLVVNGTRTKIE